MQIIDSIARLAGRAMRRVRAGDEGLAKNVLGATEAITIRSTAFDEGEALPAACSHSEGNSTSPALEWSGVPEGTRELVLLCEDPDIPGPKPFCHWVLYGLSPSVTHLPEGLRAAPAGAAHGRNTLRGMGYMGPHPPQGHGAHHYHFQLFALSAPLGLRPGATRDQVVTAMRGRVLACGDRVGTYTR